MPISLASETTLRITKFRCQVYMYSIGKFRTLQKEFPSVLIIVSRFFLTVKSLLAVTVCLLLKIISACLHICSRRRVLLFETIIIHGDKF